MLALTLTESLGIIGGIAVVVVVLIFLFRPLRLHVTVRHERDDDRDSKEE